ncbi:MAG TPA: nuclear transport factor 2 family protein [Rhodopila sp.]|nr:nuclear transport factor 2 family protein [Rhodopila sp.]
MDLTHIHAFTAAMQKKDLDTMLSQMAEGVVLNTPLTAEPVHGKVAIREVVGPLLRIVDSFDFQEVMEGPLHVSSFFKVTVDSVTVDAMDFWRLDDTGLIAEMTVLWRPLPAVAEVARILSEGQTNQG